MDSSNQFLVSCSPGRWNHGRVRIIKALPLDQTLSRDDARNLGFHLCLASKVTPQEFQKSFDEAKQRDVPHE